MFLEERILTDLANARQDALERANRLDVLRQPHAHRQAVAVAKFLVGFDLVEAGVAVAYGRQAHGVVVHQQFPQPLRLLRACGCAAGGLDLHVARAIAQDAGQLARLQVLLGKAAASIDDLEVTVHSAEPERHTVERGVRAGGEQHRMLGRHAIQLRAGRIALFAQAGDEDLPQDDPLPFREHPRAGLDVIEHILDAFHRRNGMFELRQARIGGVNV